MYIFFADLFEFAVLHLDGGMVLDLLPNIPVPSDRGILPREALTLLKQKIKIITNTPAVKVESSMKSENYTKFNDMCYLQQLSLFFLCSLQLRSQTLLLNKQLLFMNLVSVYVRNNGT